MGQRGLVEGVLAHARELVLGDLQGPFQPKPFQESVIILVDKVHRKYFISGGQMLKQVAQRA